MNVQRGFGLLLVVWMVLASLAPAPLAAQVRVKAALSARQSPTISPARRQSAPPRDRWFARDKVRHAGSTAAIQIMGIGLLRLAGASRGASIIGASIVTLGASVGKEIHDAKGGGDPSARDLVWDLVGLGLGSAAVAVADPP